MWSYGVPLQPERGYYCPGCDVFGKGEECWLCGGVQLDRKKWPTASVSGHRFDPNLRHVMCSSAGSIEVEQGITDL